MGRDKEFKEQQRQRFLLKGKAQKQNIEVNKTYPFSLPFRNAFN